MRKLSILGVALVVAIAFVGIFIGPEIVAQMKGPADIQYEKGKGSPGTVTFSHQTHSQKQPSCTACHNKIFRMKNGSAELSMAKMNNGKQCGSCHDGKVVFATKEAAGCAKCHK